MEKKKENENVETTEQLDIDKISRELEKWNKDQYHIGKLDFIVIGLVFAIAPVLVPIWFASSLLRHFNGKDITKEVEVREVK